MIDYIFKPSDGLRIVIPYILYIIILRPLLRREFRLVCNPLLSYRGY